MGMRRNTLRRKLHLGFKCGQGYSDSFFPPAQVQLLYSKTKANNGHPFSSGGDKKKKSIKLAFESSAIELPATLRI
jgi:hypothetical protein